MRLVIQKVKRASVSVASSPVSSIGAGLLVLVGLHSLDTSDDLAWCAKKLLACKIWDNDDGKLWRKGVKDMDLEVLLVSQFTLYGGVHNKRSQPDFKHAMKAESARGAYEEFKAMVSSAYGNSSKIKDGSFGELMDVELVNDGPVTIVVDSLDREGRQLAGGAATAGSAAVGEAKEEAAEEP